MSIGESLPYGVRFPSCFASSAGVATSGRPNARGQARKQEPEVSLGQDDREAGPLESRGPESAKSPRQRRCLLRSSRQKPQRTPFPGPPRSARATCRRCGPMTWRSTSPATVLVGRDRRKLGAGLRAGTRLQRVAEVLSMPLEMVRAGRFGGQLLSVRLWLLRLGLYQLKPPQSPARTTGCGSWITRCSWAIANA